MRTSSLLALLVSILVPALGGCATTGDAAAPAADDAAASAESDGTAKEGDAAEAASDAGASSGKRPKKGKAAKSDGEEEDDDDKSDEEKEKEEAEKKWEKAVEDLEETTGFFTMFHDDQKLLLQLGEKDFGRPFFYFGALNSGAGNGFIYRGNMLDDSPYVMRFERRGEEHVALTVDNSAYADPADGREKRMLDESTVRGYVHAFDVAAELEDEGKLLVDLGSWFMSDNFKLARGVPGGKPSVNKDLSLFTEL